MIDLSTILLLNKETRNPAGLFFNSCGVAQNVFRLTLVDRNKHKAYITLAGINGVWAGAEHVFGPTYSMSGPIIRADFAFSSIEDCVADSMKHIDGYISHTTPIFKEAAELRRNFDAWMKLPTDEKLKTLTYEEV